ncbi:TRAP transporter large permease [Virgibacillus salexigens]|uniref:Neu5Ac permease n=1 Tax=Virgibacillus massiliensis TaxID=1462526 RepID=A0A024QA33_9BACI|nr:TRAP transporter large permease subunit [Virgibacillus massiliensis]CDQ38806.1 Neu5Ac permease [Virgibacillus massiliensis]
MSQGSSVVKGIQLSTSKNKRNPWNRFLKGLDRRLEEVLIVIGFLVFTILINLQVINRYLLPFIEIANITTWTEEVARYLFVFVSFIGASLSVKNRESIQVTIAVDKLSSGIQKSISTVTVIFMLYFSYILIHYGVDMILFQLETAQTTPALSIPMAIPYSAIPVGFLFISIRLLQNLWQDMKGMTVKEGWMTCLIAALFIIPSLFLTHSSIAILLFGYFLLFILIGMPIAFALGISTLATVLVTDAIPIDFFPQTAFTSIDNFPIMAVPFFIAAGVIMGSSSMIKKLLHLSDELLGFLPGGLALVAIVTSMFFSAISGSGPATVAAIGTLLIPAMIKQGYHPGFATAIVAAAGTIGVIIPPSNPLVIYGVVSQQSISQLFMAGILPGILSGVALMVVTYVIAKKKGWRGNQTSFQFKSVLRAAWDAKLALLVPIFILGGIYGGIMTPTEAAAVAVLYGLIIGMFVYKDLSMKAVYENVVKAGMTSSIIILLIVMASIFGKLITLERVAETVANFVLGISENQIIILLLLNILLLLVGLVIEALAAIVILTPILLPMAMEIGVHPIHFGLMMIFNLAIGFITPPVGVNLFVAASVAKLRIEEVIKGIGPLLVTLVVILLFITYIPAISMWLVDVLR